jgi:hypothetical protein
VSSTTTSSTARSTRVTQGSLRAFDVEAGLP